MNITQETIDNLNAKLTVVVGPQDYETRVEEGIKKASKQIALPGFRPGKVPVGMVKKMHGKAILVDELNKILSESLNNYIAENKIEILGHPLPKQDDAIDFEKQKEFTFNYEIGLSPKFEVELDKNIKLNYEVVEVDNALIEKYVKDVRKNYGKPVNPEVATEIDVLFVDINELEADGTIKAGGLYKSTSIGIERLKSEAAKKKLIGAKKEDKIVIAANELYETALDRSISLGIEKEAAEDFTSNLQLTVSNISRLEDADLNEELFTRIYPDGNIKTEDDFRAKIKEELTLMFVNDQDRKLIGEVEKTFVEKYNLQLPEDFLKRWLVAVNEKPVTLEQVNAEFENYANSMKWKLIENKIISKYELKVTSEEATAEAIAYVKGQYARYGQVVGDEEAEKIAKNLLSQQKQAESIFENLYAKKVLETVKANCTLNNKAVSYNEFFGIKE